MENRQESELVSILEGSEFEIICAFEYFWRQISCESRMTAPFELGYILHKKE